MTTPLDREGLCAKVVESIGANENQLIALSHDIHDHPELAFVEHISSARVAKELSGAGFDVQMGAYELPTAIRAEYGSGDFTATICAEYDALPGIGHACGHNVIASSAVGAAIGLAAVAEELNLHVVVLGTPAEEHGGGKAIMLKRGAWDDATLSLMVHPYPDDAWPTATVMQAVHRLRFTFTGKGSHAAAAPHLARNAADAATLSLVAIGLLRQQVRDGARLNAIITEAGTVTNIIADASVVDVEIREADRDALVELECRVTACFEGAATATGVTWHWEEAEPLYENLVQDEYLVGRFAHHLSTRGRPVDSAEPRRGGGSTDMGNVSQVVPSIHPAIGVLGAQGPIHTPEFATAARGPQGDRATIDSAIAMALTVVDAAVDPTQRTRLKAAQEHREPSRDSDSTIARSN